MRLISSSIDHLLRLCARFLILFHLTKIRFSRSTYLLMFLSLETLKSITRAGLPILVELIDLVNSVIIFDLTKMVNFPTRMPNCDSHSPALLDVFLLTLIFVLQWPSLHWENVIILLSQFALTFHRIPNGMPRFIA